MAKLPILPVEMPAGSQLLKRVLVHYSDAFAAPVRDVAGCLLAADAGKSFFTAAPGWIGKLMAVRNALVRLVGLKTGSAADRAAQLAAFRCEPGEQLGVFRVYAADAHEVVLGEDDKHLNFRVSMWLDGPEGDGLRRLTVSTTVQFHNVFGRLYFLPVRLFHRRIVPVMLRAQVRQLEALAAARQA